MRVRCPHCGERDHTEFVWGGDATVRRPTEPTAVSDETWTDYLYFRNNYFRKNAAVITERWHHVYGCRAWFERVRDTTQHRWIDV